MSRLPAYDEPWTVEEYLVVHGDTAESCPERHRVVKCVNLLAMVPDDAPCFQNRFHSDEILLALSVLAGDHGSAACLADEIIAKYSRPEPPLSSKARVGGESGYLEAEVTDRGRVFWRGGTRKLLVRQRVFRRAADQQTLMWVAEVAADKTPVWCDFNPRDPAGLNGAKKEVAAAFDAYHGLSPTVPTEVTAPPPIRVGEQVRTVHEIGPLFGHGRMLPPGVEGVVMDLMAPDGFAVDTEYGLLYIEERDLIPVRDRGL